MTGLESLLPAFGYAGGLGVLLYLVIHLLRALRADRNSYLEQLARKQSEVEAEEKAHGETQRRLDGEMERRRAAEDMVAEMRRDLGALTAKVKHLETEVARLRGAVDDTPGH